jgi:hypothetical protein
MHPGLAASRASNRGAVREPADGLHRFDDEVPGERLLPGGRRAPGHDAMDGTDDQARVGGGHDGRHRVPRGMVVRERPLAFQQCVPVVHRRFVAVVPVGM